MSDSPVPKRRSGFLDLIEWMGNKLPEPTTLFVIAAVTVMILSHVGHLAGWQVQPVRPKTQLIFSSADSTTPTGKPAVEIVRDPNTGHPVLEAYGDPIRPVSLLTADGIYWALSTMVRNFVNFPPLGIILTCILGVGVAERTGLIAAALNAMMLLVPSRLLTPTMVFIGVNSSLASDAGYIVLPPASALLFASVGRSPIVGMAAAFAGVAAGTSANLLVTPGDAIMAGFTQRAAQIVDTGYAVTATSNWYFKAASAILLTLVGWAVTAWFVEPRFRTKSSEDGGPSGGKVSVQSTQLTPQEKRALLFATASHIFILVLIFAAILIPEAPLYGKEPKGERTRWIETIVPLILISFSVPGVVYGIVMGTIRRDKDVTQLLTESMVSMSSVIVLAFFAAQFISYFDYSNLGRMLAMVAGKALGTTRLSIGLLLVVFVTLIMMSELLVSSMSAKYAIMSPIFVPMFMLLGVSPELTQAAYRVADSATNATVPLNYYLGIILTFIHRYLPRAGMGTLLSLMAPYSIAFAITWTALLLAWLKLGVPLGIGGPLQYIPSG